ncbi:aldehyde dehydrogenase family protein [Flavilitoribacter nigricans DSM 23189 = NBRC 102662]|uniref:Aldehyde dehydrogenase n=1 Tax=Flavilitoribacter nigricans (strain ATCC 23147 / DSM 23189 / NBRC 102662 / NCIMB 1420 / SS-2) TaxID=1122177 RepID=A0A2D0NFC9_FLAN2|nr:aldehyde dehydrogenase family protein [Flavilitoribacter nigricans DSM 23189 = NBRC 102662]
MTVTTIQDKASREELQRLFEAQRAHQFQVADASIRERKAKLKALKQAIMVTYRQEIRDALQADMGKSQIEADLIEIFPVIKEIKHALSNLGRWTGKHFVSTPLAFLGSRSYVEYEPKGVCLLISPWNFPINLTFGPLVGAIAAGNTVIVKPSEFTPHCSRLMAKIIADLFPEKEITLVQGAVETSTRLLELPFDHIFFTGSPKVGKVVMAAAARNLTSITLELGGKSPTIVDETADIDTAARRTASGKWINAGQICIAPDHVFVHESRIDDFNAALSRHLDNFFGGDATRSADYTEMVNREHLERVKSYLDDSLAKGASIVYGGQINRENNRMAPTVVTNVTPDSALMQKEIFGPVLPVIPFRDLDTLLKQINAGEKPLALYIFSKSSRNIRYIRRQTRAGTTCINHNGIHYFHPELPFGGSNNSGIGKAHGFYTFEAFSNSRAYYRQVWPTPLDLLAPPYQKWKEKVVEFTIRYL